MDIKTQNCDFSGIDGITAGLARLQSFAERDVLKKALKAEAQVIANSAKQNVPHRSGALERAIKVRAGRGGKGVVTYLASAATKWFKGEQFYGAFQEFGWKQGKRGGGLKSKGLLERASLLRAQRKAGGSNTKSTEQKLRASAAAHAEKATAARKAVPGEHYMEYAFDENAPTSLNRLLTSIKSGIETEAAKVGTTI